MFLYKYIGVLFLYSLNHGSDNDPLGIQLHLSSMFLFTPKNLSLTNTYFAL